MYTTVDNDVNIEWTYDPRPLVKVTGDNNNEVFLVQIFEYYKGNTIPYFLESYLLPNGTIFQYNVTYYGKFEIRVIRFSDEIGHYEIFRDVYDDRGKDVRFVLNTKSLAEEELMIGSVNQYIKENGCNPTIQTKIYNSPNFEETKQSLEDSFDSMSFDSPYYKTFWVGRNFWYGDNHYEHRFGYISYGNWRLFSSFHNPRDYYNLSAVEVAEDILGLTEKYNKHDGFVVTPSYL